jgi:competence protein ComGC
MFMDQPKISARSGFTKIDCLIVLCTIALLAGLLLPALQKAKPRSKRINCVSNIKQIGLALRMFANDHQDEFPWHTPIEKGGTMERALNGDPTVQFLALSNELTSGKPLTCTSDAARTGITNLSRLSRTNISYFVCLDANVDSASNLLSGDRNIAGTTFSNGAFVLPIQSNQAGWGTNIHCSVGNIGLADGSAQQLTKSGLNKQVQIMTNETLRLLIP